MTSHHGHPPSVPNIIIIIIYIGMDIGIYIGVLGI